MRLTAERSRAASETVVAAETEVDMSVPIDVAIIRSGNRSPEIKCSYSVTSECLAGNRDYFTA